MIDKFTCALFQENEHVNDLQRNVHSLRNHKLDKSKGLQMIGTQNIFVQLLIRESAHIDRPDNLRPPIELNTDYEKYGYIILLIQLISIRPYLESQKMPLNVIVHIVMK